MVWEAYVNVNGYSTTVKGTTLRDIANKLNNVKPLMNAVFSKGFGEITESDMRNLNCDVVHSGKKQLLAECITTHSKKHRVIDGKLIILDDIPYNEDSSSYSKSNNGRNSSYSKSNNGYSGESYSKSNNGYSGESYSKSNNGGDSSYSKSNNGYSGESYSKSNNGYSGESYSKSNNSGYPGEYSKSNNGYPGEYSKSNNGYPGKSSSKKYSSYA